MKAKNLVITGTKEFLDRLEEEYCMLGFYVTNRDGTLTVYTLKPKPIVSKKRKRKT